MVPVILPVAVPDDTPLGPLWPAGYDIIWSLVSVAIIAFVLGKLVIPKVLATLDERAEKIEGGIKAGEAARAEAEAMRASFGEAEEEARREAAAIRDRANQDAKAIVADGRTKAESEAQRLAANAGRQIEADRQAAEISLRTDVGLMAAELASRIVGEALTDGDMQARVIDRFLNELEAESSVSAVHAEGEHA